MLQRRVDKIGYFGECDDFVEFSIDFPLSHAENRAIQVSILAACELWMKTCADFEEAAHPAIDFRITNSGLRDARKNLEQRGFSSAIAADQAHYFSPANFK